MIESHLPFGGTQQDSARFGRAVLRGERGTPGEVLGRPRDVTIPGGPTFQGFRETAWRGKPSRYAMYNDPWPGIIPPSTDRSPPQTAIYRAAGRYRA